MVRSHTVLVGTLNPLKKSLVGGGEWWWWQTNFNVSPGLWSLVLGTFGPDLGPDLDLTWDLDLSLKIPYISFSNKSVKQKMSSRAGIKNEISDGVFSSFKKKSSFALYQQNPGSQHRGISPGSGLETGSANQRALSGGLTNQRLGNCL